MFLCHNDCMLHWEIKLWPVNNFVPTATSLIVVGSTEKMGKSGKSKRRGV